MRTVKELERAVGGLSTPTKMPGFAYGIPAVECMMGSILRKKAGSVCSKCYAHKGMYSFPVVKQAQARRLEKLSNLPKWQADMIDLLRFKYRNKKGQDRVFRWHDSGDLQSLDHLKAIIAIARELPDIRFWLPTKERTLVSRYRGSIPSNLTVRVSAPMIGQRAGSVFAGTVSSTVGAGVGYSCPAYSQGGQCGDCRACWNKSVKSVDYPLH